MKIGAIACFAVLAATGLMMVYEPQADPRPPTTRRRIPSSLWQKFSGDEAFENVRRQVEFGPRPSGSEALEKTRVFIEKRLERYGWNVERQSFRAKPSPNHPELEFTNLIGRFSGAKAPPDLTTQRAIVCSHYDIKRQTGVVCLGANNGASSTGALIELARILATAPALAEQIELVFFDGEEALEDYTETDGLVGSRYFAAQLHHSGRAAQFQFAILWNLVGSRELTFTLPSDTPPELADGLRASANALGLEGRLVPLGHTLVDDHKCLELIAHIPAAELIDFNYAFLNTADDSLDKLSPESLQTTGQLTLHYLLHRLRR